jgi:hypothetical protein
MQNGLPSAHSPVSHSRAPEILFANWREMLNPLKLDRRASRTYAQAIECYLDYCLGNGLQVGVESARGLMSGEPAGTLGAGTAVSYRVPGVSPAYL